MRASVQSKDVRCTCTQTPPQVGIFIMLSCTLYQIMLCGELRVSGGNRVGQDLRMPESDALRNFMMNPKRACVREKVVPGKKGVFK